MHALNLLMQSFARETGQVWFFSNKGRLHQWWFVGHVWLSRFLLSRLFLPLLQMWVS